MITVEEFIQKHGIEMTAVRIEKRTDMDDVSDWAKDASHWTCTLAYRPHPMAPLRTMVTQFSQGSAHTDKPVVEDVLDSLMRDASALDCDSFEEWAGELGVDTDSRKAERTYRQCCLLGDQLSVQLLGNVLFEELRDEVEPQ